MLAGHLLPILPFSVPFLIYSSHHSKNSTSLECAKSQWFNHEMRRGRKLTQRGLCMVRTTPRICQTMRKNHHRNHSLPCKWGRGCLCGSRSQHPCNGMNHQGKPKRSQRTTMQDPLLQMERCLLIFKTFLRKCASCNFFR